MNKRLPWLLVAILAPACAFLSLREVSSTVTSTPRDDALRVAGGNTGADGVGSRPAEATAHWKAYVDAAEVSEMGEVLKGVGAISVYVNDFADGDPLVRNARGNIQASTELAIRQSGLRITSGAPHEVQMDISVLWLDPERSRAAFSLYFRIVQHGVRVEVQDAGKFRRANLTTYQRAIYNYRSRADLVECIRDSAAQVVTGFCNDYLEQNPRSR